MSLLIWLREVVATASQTTIDGSCQTNTTKSRAVWWMRVDIDSLLSSILAF